MTQVIQYDKNPSAEGAAVRVSRVGATPTLGTDTFTSWPPQGSKSHKLVATATTIATVGLPNADRPAAAPGSVWSVVALVRASQARSVSLSIVFYNTAGATLGTATGTTSDTDTFTAGEIRTMFVAGAIAPAATASVDVQLSRNAGSGAAISDAVFADCVSLTRTSAPVAYRDPSLSAFATWSGTANASTQVYWDASITVTPYLDAAPCPRVEVFVTDLPPAVDSLTVYRLADGREYQVRGAVSAPTGGTLTRIDFEIPFGMPVTYRAELFDDARNSLGITATAGVTLTVGETWLHNPLDPQGAVRVELAATTGTTLSRPVPGVVSRPLGRRVGVVLAEPRRGLSGFQFDVRALDLETADKVQALIGTYDRVTVPVICIRLGGDHARLRVPKPLFLGVFDIAEVDMNVAWGGEDTRQLMNGDESAPPIPGLFIPLLTNADLNAYYGSNAALKADNLTNATVNRRYDLAGFSA